MTSCLGLMTVGALGCMNFWLVKGSDGQYVSIYQKRDRERIQTCIAYTQIMYVTG